jgi:hypothetical protein
VLLVAVEEERLPPVRRLQPADQRRVRQVPSRVPQQLLSPSACRR